MTIKFNWKFTIFLFLIMTSGIRAQDETANSNETKYPETMIVRLVETFDGPFANNSKIVTIKSDNAVEIKDLDKSKVNDNEAEGMTGNLIKLRIELQKWHNFGFLIKSSSSTSVDANVSITTVFLEKN